MHTEAIGEVLAEARRKLEKSIKEVEFDTKIRGRYIEALERDDFECLPGDTYARGFIKTYAAYLGIDPKPLIQQYNGLHVQQYDYDITHMSANMRIATKKRSRWFKFVVGFSVLAAVFAGLIVWGAYNKSKNQQNIVMQDINTRGSTDTTVAATTTSTTYKKVVTSEEESDQEQDSKSNQELSTTTTTSEPTTTSKGDGKIDVTLKLTGINGTGSWVRVKVDGETEFEGLISDGETKLFEGDESIQLRVGNTPGLEVMYNGKKLSQLETASGGIAEKTFKKESSDGER